MSSYKPVPHFISSQMMSLFLETQSYSRFDFSKEDCTVVKIASSCASGRLLAGACFKDLVKGYTAYCGRMKPLPDWALDGVIAGIQGGEEAVQDIVDATLDAGVPLAAVWYAI